MAEPKCEIDRLPVECLSHVLSFASQADSSRTAVVSTTFLRAANSDTLWRLFLPSDYCKVLSRAVEPVKFSSYKELYFKLCESVLIDGGKKVFSLENLTGAKCIALCAKELRIPGHVKLIDRRLPDSRFSEAIEVCAIQPKIEGVIECRELSHNTKYKACLIFQTSEAAYEQRSLLEVRASKDDWRRMSWKYTTEQVIHHCPALIMFGSWQWKSYNFRMILRKNRVLQYRS